MFFRWKKYGQEGYWGPYWRAMLVESHRVNGKPRQRVVKYLGSISRHAIEEVSGDAPWFSTAESLVAFWRRVIDGLRDLKLPRTKRRDVLEKIKERVPAIDRQAIARWEAADAASNRTNYAGQRYNPKPEWDALAKKLPRAKL